MALWTGSVKDTQNFWRRKEIIDLWYSDTCYIVEPLCDEHEIHNI